MTRCFPRQLHCSVPPPSFAIIPSTALHLMLRSCDERGALRSALLAIFMTVKKVKADIALHGNHIQELRDVACHMESHSVTCHPTQVNVPQITPAMQAGTRFTYPGGMEGWVELVDLIVTWQGVEQATFRSRVRHWTATPPRLYYFWPFYLCMYYFCGWCVFTWNM